MDIYEDLDRKRSKAITCGYKVLLNLFRDSRTTFGLKDVVDVLPAWMQTRLMLAGLGVPVMTMR